LPFPSFIYSSSFQRFSLTSKFEKAFEEIRKNNRDCKETLRNYSFKKPRREAGPSEQVDPISIFYMKKRSRRTICNRNKKSYYIKKSLPRIRLQKKSTFVIRSAQREQIDK
jgi:hypothetical protein